MEKFLLSVSIGCLLILGGIHCSTKVDNTDSCNAYCFSMTKPLLEHLNQTKDNVAAAHDQMKAKILDLEKQIKEKDEFISKIMALAEADDELPDSFPYISSIGIQQIQILGAEPFKAAYISPISGWTVIQRRFNGSEDFDRSWNDYKRGFGDLQGEFFLGLEKLHLMTEAHPHELHIQLRDINGTTRYARYDNFKVGSEAEGYSLKSVGEYTGTAGDSLSEHEHGKFLTADGITQMCVKEYDGPWWYTDVDCGKSSLNGQYFQDGIAKQKNGISWGSWRDENDYTISLTSVQMMIRPSNN